MTFFRQSNQIVTLTRSQLAILASLGAGILLSRFSIGVLHAELWGDDGWTFFPQAYEIGWRSLALPVNGYLNSAQRLGALLMVGTHAPLAWVPTLFALLALGVQLLVALFVVGPRLSPIWPVMKGRLAAAFLYLALPNSLETFGNLTNVQWHLSLLAFMIIIAPGTTSWRWKTFDAVILMLSGFSGPFCIMLVPFAAYRLWLDRLDWNALLGSGWRAALISGCAVIQIGILLFDNTIRHIGGLDTVRILARIISLQIVMGLLFGLDTINDIAGAHWWNLDIYPFAIATMALMIGAVGFVRGGIMLRTFTLFCAIVFVSELASPVPAPGKSPWQEMTIPWADQRYYLFPMLGLGAIIISYAGQRTRLERGIGMTLLAVTCLWAIPRDWFYPNLGHTNFVAVAHAFAAAPPGTRAVFPIHPPGSSMTLIKQPD